MSLVAKNGTIIPSFGTCGGSATRGSTTRPYDSFLVFAYRSRPIHTRGVSEVQTLFFLVSWYKFLSPASSKLDYLNLYPEANDFTRRSRRRRRRRSISRVILCSLVSETISTSTPFSPDFLNLQSTFEAQRIKQTGQREIRSKDTCSDQINFRRTAPTFPNDPRIIAANQLSTAIKL